jgi:hypothetical protein
MKETFTRKEVVDLIKILLHHPDQIDDYLYNENTDWDAEEFLELAEQKNGY